VATDAFGDGAEVREARMSTPEDDVGDSDIKRGRLEPWLNMRALIPALLAGLIAWGLGAPSWAILFVAVAAGNRMDFEHRWSNFEKAWSDFLSECDQAKVAVIPWMRQQDAHWERLHEWLEKNRR
jgi:hypothetical protein